MIIETRAYARAGLLGNPSDGYFGKTISISVKNFGAHITLYQSPELKIEPQTQDINVFSSIHDLIERVKTHSYYGGDRLIKAAIKAFADYCKQNRIRLENKNFTIRYHSSIPRQVGLAGSSAIITAAMRALTLFYNVEIPQEIFPSIVLKAETEELGINAGLQDRVIQAYEGCVYMDFDKQVMETKQHGGYERLAPKTLDTLYIAYKIELSKVSGSVLNDIKARYDRGEAGLGGAAPGRFPVADTRHLQHRSFAQYLARSWLRRNFSSGRKRIRSRRRNRSKAVHRKYRAPRATKAR